MKSLYHLAIKNVTGLLPLVIGDVKDVSSELLIMNLVIEIVLQVVYRVVLKFIYLLVKLHKQIPNNFLLFIGILFCVEMVGIWVWLRYFGKGSV